MIRPVVGLRCRLPGCRCLGGARLGTIDKLVQLAAVEPYPAALRAIVDFDTLALAHEQLGLDADGTFHAGWTGTAAGGSYSGIASRVSKRRLSQITTRSA